MDFRSAIHSKPGVTIGICIAAVVIFGLLMLRGVKPSYVKSHYSNLGNYYTADEGQNWIPDAWSELPPFDRNGKTWLRVYVFTCGTGKPFAGYLEKFTPEALADIGTADEQRFKIVKIQELGNHGLLVKRPTTGDWVAKDSPEGEAVVKIECPDGGTPKPMLPEIPLPNAH